ncbi:uncharacterized protein LOC135845686 [Planococcus citri]|uniref:uncharacterized protein LOC135845686 n=1 Tax=Planococcus citri TaxID=170843 RepID=UPI0031F72B0F
METSAVNNLSEQFDHLELDAESDECAMEKDSDVGFYETLPSLQQMSSIVIAINLWHPIVNDCNHDDDLYFHSERAVHFFNEKDVAEVLKLADKLPLPRSLRELVVKCIDPAKQEMNEWSRCYAQSVFGNRRVDSREAIKRKDLNFCYWLPNGKIDHKKTASNMLSNSRLSVADKFEIMCKYCLEDEFRKIAAENSTDFLNQVFNKDLLKEYWHHQICNLLSEEKKKSLEALLITTPNVDTWPALEYFWDRLSVSEQTSKVLVLLNRKPQFQRQLFLKMNDEQRRYVISKIPVDIVRNFWKQGSCELFAFLSWIYGVETMTFEQFVELMEDLLAISLPHHAKRLRYLVKMWNCSPTHFKTRAVQSMSKKVVFLHTEICWTRWEDDKFLPSNFNFLLAFLYSASVEFRKEILFENVDKFVLRNDSPMIHELVNLCLPSTQDVVEFRNFLTNSLKVQIDCYYLLVGSVDDRQRLAKLILNYFPDPDAKADFICTLVLSKLWSDLSIDNWNDAINFIESNLDVDSHEANILKTRIAWSFATTQIQFKWSENRVREFITSIISILDTEGLKTYKNNALETFRAKYDWLKFRIEDIEGFLMWCFDQDSQQITQFKKSFSIENIFQYCWRDSEGQRATLEELSVLDEILFWYFENCDDVKAYKFEKICNLFDRNNFNIDDDFARDVLPWFFDRDPVEIHKFKELYKDDPISVMIWVPDSETTGN